MEYVVSSRDEMFPSEKDFLLTGFFPALKPDLEKRGIFLVKRLLFSYHSNNLPRPLIIVQTASMAALLYFILFLVSVSCFGAVPVSPSSIPDQDWGYVDVRPGAHMFWWLYGCTGSILRQSRPLVMWLQVS